MWNFDNTKKQGTYGLSCAIKYFTSKGYCVSLPLNDSQDYDLIVDINNTLLRVQIKTSKYKTKYGIFNFNVKSTGGNSKVNKILKTHVDILYDLLYIVCEDGSKYLFPRSEIVDQDSFNLGDKYIKYKIG